jgi:glutamyl-tRNA synthetase
LYAQSGIYDRQAREALREAGPAFFDAALRCLDAAGDFKVYTKAVAEVTGRKGKALFMPLRAALTGEINPDLQRHAHTAFDWHAGPELARVWELLAPARIRRRLEAARAIASEPSTATSTSQ